MVVSKHDTSASIGLFEVVANLSLHFVPRPGTTFFLRVCVYVAFFRYFVFLGRIIFLCFSSCV